MIFKKMADREYRETRGINASLIKEIYSDHELFLYNKKKGIKKGSKSMRIGSIVHCLILEPQEYADRYMVAGSSATTNIYKEAVKENPEKIIITKPEQELALEIVEYNPEVSSIFSATQNEMAVVGKLKFSDKMFDVKGKLDGFITHDNFYSILDLKTTADLEWFAKDAIKFGYHIQAGFYKWLTDEAFPDKKFYNYKIVVIETKPPYKSKLYECTPAFVGRGQAIAFDVFYKYFVNGEVDNYTRPYMDINPLKIDDSDDTLGSILRREKLISTNF